MNAAVAALSVTALEMVFSCDLLILGFRSHPLCPGWPLGEEKIRNRTGARVKLSQQRREGSSSISFQNSHVRTEGDTP